MLIGCQEKKTSIQIDQEFLTDWWAIDSIYGSDQYIFDDVFFTPEGEFWWCSKRNKSLILDSALLVKNDRIFKEGVEKYKIQAVDSNYMTLTTTDNVSYGVKRRRDFDPKYLKRYIKSNPIKLKINGSWVLDSTQVNPSRVPSYCDDLYPGSRFIFHPKGRLNIFQNDSVETCNSYSYSLREKRLSITEYDMIMRMHIEHISKNKLVLRSKYIPRNIGWTKSVLEYRANGYLMYFSKIEE